MSNTPMEGRAIVVLALAQAEEVLTGLGDRVAVQFQVDGTQGGD